MNYIMIEHNHSNVRIWVELEGATLESIRYIGSSINDAIRDYRRCHGLKYKRLIRIDI